MGRKRKGKKSELCLQKDLNPQSHACGATVLSLVLCADWEGEPFGHPNSEAKAWRDISRVAAWVAGCSFNPDWQLC